MNATARTFIHWLARAGLCLAYAYSGVAKLLDWQGGIAEQRHFGLEPPAAFLLATIVVQLGGSALVLFTHARAAAAGALTLAAFTLIATVIGHSFWNDAGLDRFRNLNSFLEHFGLIGGFVLVALDELSHSPRHETAARRVAHER